MTQDKTRDRREQLRDIVHNPAALAAETVAWAEHITTTPGVPFGVPCIDKHMNPMHPGDLVVICGRPGHGKCFAPGTMVMLYDGDTKSVEQVYVGDRLMGPDSLPRVVTALGHGMDDMYEVVPVKGDPYTVNSEHILTLQMSGYNDCPTGTVINLTVKEYLTKSDKFKSKAKGYRAGTDWPAWPVPIEPYYLGIWLGDGTTGNTAITSVDEPIIEYIREYAARLGMRFSVINGKDRCPNYNIVGNKGALNPIRENLRRLGVFDRKDVIPYIYKVNSRAVRLGVLAGLVDTDGSYHRHNMSITQKSKTMADDIAFLCRSLGFAAYIRERQCTCGNTGAVGTYYRINISGDLSQIPTLLPRKQVPPRRQVKSVLRTGITVRPVGRGAYYGFELDGPDRLFLLADFTVVHNTSLLATLARAEAKRIQARGTAKKEAVFYVTWEQVAEEINLVLDVNEYYTASQIMRGEVDMDTVKKQSFKRVNLPIWVIGDSISKTNTKSLRLFPDVIFDAIEQAVEDHDVKPTLMLFDYIQIVPARNVSEKVMQVSMAAESIKELAKRIGCPGVLGAQARRDVDDREFKIPTLRDPQWASAIEQVTDKFFGVWRPWLTDMDKPPITVGGTQYPITEELCILQMGKQRFGKAGMSWGLHFQPQHLQLCEMEVRKTALNFE